MLTAEINQANAEGVQGVQEIGSVPEARRQHGFSVVLSNRNSAPPAVIPGIAFVTASFLLALR